MAFTENGNGNAFELRVKQGKPTLVPPAEQTASGLYFLSNLDQNAAFIIQTVHCFKAEDKGNEGAAELIKDALAKLLVFYYPLAGRLTISQQGKLIVDCNGAGAVFVEAEADCDMADIGDIAKPDPSTSGKLVYNVPDANNILETPLLVAQCGGFILGLSTNHCLVDGISFIELVRSWGEIARNLPISLPPFLDRTILAARTPPLIQFRHREFQIFDDDDDETSDQSQPSILYRSFIFTPDKLHRLKTRAAAKCTSFEALAGFVWRARTRALGTEPDRMTNLLFVVDGRRRFEPPLPKGFFGNGIAPVSAMATAGELFGNDVGFAVGKVKEAVRMATDGYMRSAIDYFEETRARPPLAMKPSLAATMMLTAWWRLDFYAMDFGWGEAVQSGPGTLPAKGLVMFLNHGKEMNGVTVLLGLPASSMETFQQIMDEFLDM